MFGVIRLKFALVKRRVEKERAKEGVNYGQNNKTVLKQAYVASQYR